MKRGLKIFLVIILVLVGIILLDSLQAFVFNNNPIIKVRTYYNGGLLRYKDSGMLVDTYCGFNGKKDTVLKGYSYSLSYEGSFEIIDEMEENPSLACAEALEGFYEDDKYIYYFECIKSGYVKVKYKNGMTEGIISALNNKHVNISDLDRFGIGYYKRERYDKVSDLKSDKADVTTLVKFEDTLYGKSFKLIDYAGGSEAIGKIDKLTAKENVPRYNGETNTADILNALVFDKTDNSIVLKYNNVYVLFERL